MSLPRANSVDVEVGLRLRARRDELGLTQKALADALGVTQQQIQKYEQGRNRLSASRLHALTRILSVPCSYFFQVGGLGADPAKPASWLSDPECRRMSEAFLRIRDADVRNAVLAMIETLAAREGVDGSNDRPE